jgi:hypothetical protein
MKFAKDSFPMGTYPRQTSAGLYMDETKSKNFDVMVRAMKKDIFFTAIYSGDNMSGTGKTTEMTQDGCYFTHKINEVYGSKNTFTSENIFFKIDDLIKAAPKFAKEQPYSVLCLDEPDELNEHQMKKKSFELRSAFRKLRQLNLIFLLTSHSFFELPKFYALNRAQYLVNVVFSGEFDRGFFKFYGPRAKKLLYFKGKKEWDYDAYYADFQGRIGPSYSFFPNCKEETAKYLKRKEQDMLDELNGDNKPKVLDEKTITKQLFRDIHARLPEIPVKDLVRGFAVSTRTGFNWLSEDKQEKSGATDEASAGRIDYINNLIDKGENVDGDAEDEPTQSNRREVNNA